MRRRLLASTVAITLLALTVLGVPLAYLLDRVVRATAVARLQHQVDAIALAVSGPLRAGRLPTPEELAGLAPPGDRVVVRLGDATVTAGGAAGQETLAASTDLGGGDVVRLETSEGPFDARIRRSVLILLGVAAAGLGGAVLLAVAQGRRFARPLEALARAADRLGAGDFSVAAPRCGLPEIDAVADALETGGRRVAEMVRAERQFSAHASHQLRSALTGLSLSLEELAVDTEPAITDGVSVALDHVSRLSATVEDLLRLARTGRAGERRSFDAARLAAQHVEDWRPRFAHLNRVLDLVASEPMPVRAAPGALGQALDVLLSNALRHGDGAATVVLRQVDGWVEADISDEGPGVGASAGAELFDARGVTLDGHGIGLPLARLLVEAEGGSLELVAPRTATFRLRLTAADSALHACGSLDALQGER